MDSSRQTLLTVLNNFWEAQHLLIQQSRDFKEFQLPLARIKKVMKTDDDVKNMMISAEAPIIFAKACEIFILELTLRAWMNTEESKRRTLQRPDVVQAINKNDMLDFLIDIIPREDLKKKSENDYSSLTQAPTYFYPTAAYAGLQELAADPSALMAAGYQYMTGAPDMNSQNMMMQQASVAAPAQQSGSNEQANENQS